MAQLGVAHRVIRHRPVDNLAQAAQARAITPADVGKTPVVRRGENDYLFVLVPGDRVISWPKLRSRVRVSRLSVPDGARRVTGDEPGTITPLGATVAWPVIADERLDDRWITAGAGTPVVAIGVEGTELVTALGGRLADVTAPQVR